MEDKKIAIIGLGYVGLPLAVEFGKKRKVVGYDYNNKRISQLKNFVDITNEVSKKELKAIKKKVYFTSNPSEISSCNFFIITVPTPVKKNNVPDFSFLILASEMIGQLLKKGDIVVYESTVYPGATEEICLPILEEKSKLKLNKDFFLGYSPERINPGDKKHKLANVIKIVSASNKKSLKIINDLYLEVVKAGVFKASSIKVAEASKVIENTQRDLNIALVNELSQIFNKLNIDTEEVLKGASTKWNFIKFTPGLVGGHCIGVDPYFLTFKSKKAGYNPVPLASTDILSGLQTGLIDAIPTMPIYALAQQSFGIANHMLDLKWGVLLAGIIIDKRTWNKIPSKYHEELVKIAQEISRKHQATNLLAETQSIDAMKQYGLQIHTPTEREVELWKSEVKNMENNLRGNVIPKDVYDKVIELTKD